MSEEPAAGRITAEIMQRTMAVLRCPDTVAPETRSVAGGEFSDGGGGGTWCCPIPSGYAVAPLLRRSAAARRYLDQRQTVLHGSAGGIRDPRRPPSHAMRTYLGSDCPYGSVRVPA